jgi:two-component system chemotaxis response regulator CheB
MTILSKIRVLIVDDSLFFLKMLERGLASDPRIEVIGTAMDADEAEEKIRQLRPDVVTLDVEMPRLNGIDFLRRLMPRHPVPVIVVSSLPIRVLDALEAGAVDFVRKRDANSDQNALSFLTELRAKVKIASMARVRHKAPTAAPADPPPTPPPILKAGRPDMVIAMGASTGGTEAILQVVRNLPATTPGMLVVQHMPAGFTKMYAERLNGICKMRVVEATHRERVEPGKIIVAAGDYHLRLARDTLGYYVKSEQGPKVSGHCPSVDVLFESAAELTDGRSIGVLLTGMGADGAEGLLKMRRAGCYTIGQDKESSVVYGMPQVAYNIGAVARQLPLDHISGEMIRYLNSVR